MTAKLGDAWASGDGHVYVSAILPANLGSGVYFVKLRGPEIAQVRRVVVWR